jgi:tetratricopeptide (TPR) repeat protein
MSGRPSLILAACLLGACAVAPLQPDLNARAPLLEGFGQSDFALTATHPTARRHFHQGVLQAYAFNEREAVRQFKAALAAEPGCAMCAWGVAWQLGPNINAPDRGDLRDAKRYAAYAQSKAANATARERALIDAMALRYGVDNASAGASSSLPAAALGDVCRSNRGGDNPAAHPLDVAYADRLGTLVQAFPDDADITSLWAEAQLVATRGDWWSSSTGRAAPRVGQVVDRIERLLGRAPRHTGLNHYMIHAADAAPGAARAVPAAERMASLAPQSPHLVHMPSHIFVRVGRYGEAASVNQAAVDADVALAQVQTKQGFDVSKDWRGHNLHFRWYAELMQGRGDAAMATARTLAERASRGDAPYAEYLRSLPILTLLRLERWQALAAEPLPTGGNGIAAALGDHALGVAAVRLGRAGDATQALGRVEAALATVTRAYPRNTDNHRMLRDLGQHAAARLRAELAQAHGRPDEALAAHAQAVSAAKRADDSEPPMLAAGATVALGQAQLALGQAAAAEASFRADLQAQPDSGWALRGLAHALQAQGKTADASAMRERLNRAWAQADAALKAPG